MRAAFRTGAGILLLQLAAAAGAQRLGGADEGGVSLVRLFIALFVCLAVAALAILLLRHRLGRGTAFLPRIGAGGGRLRLVESRRIAPQSDLCLVECDGAEHLLLITPGGPLAVSTRPAPEEG